MFRMPVYVVACALLVAAPAGAPLAQSKADEAKERARINALRAQVRSYRCVTKAGRKYYGSTIPAQCKGELVEALSAQGTVLFRIDPPLTPEQKAAKEAEEKRQAEAEAAKREAARQAALQARRDQALLQTYAGEDDIERARKRALASNREAATEVERRIRELRGRQEQLAKEATKYKNQAAVPQKFQQDVKAVAYDLSLQEQLLESRKQEAAEINARYDADKRKFRELTAK
jgi:hypothetical protein